MALSILLILVAAKMIVLIVIGVLLYKVFGTELRPTKSTYPMPGVKCVYCHFSPSLFHSEETRWENDDLILVKTYECRKCHLPFWKVERVPAVEHHSR